MDLGAAIFLQNQAKEKRDRQPNWTEPEKQLLLQLTSMNRAILSNKATDAVTTQQKSEVWDQIVLTMKNAGYNRSKDRLKQQLVRIRAAEAKKIKDAMDKELMAVKKGNQCVIKNSLLLNNKLTPTLEEGNENDSGGVGQLVLPKLKLISLPYQENLQVKNEQKFKPDNKELIQQQFQSPSPTNGDNKENVPHNNNNMIYEDITSDFVPTATSTMTTDPSLSTATNPSPTSSNIQQQRKGRIRRLNAPRMRTSSTREQIYSYRLTFERNRLHGLYIQQKRDRVLYRKDLQIQNLKINILRNMANQNHDANNINI